MLCGISIQAKSTALMQLCLSFKAMIMERSTLGKIYFPESHSFNGAIIPCLLAQVLEQQPWDIWPPRPVSEEAEHWAASTH